MKCFSHLGAQQRLYACHTSAADNSTLRAACDKKHAARWRSCGAPFSVSVKCLYPQHGTRLVMFNAGAGVYGPGNAPVNVGRSDSDYIEIGTISRPHGLDGEMVVTIDTSFPEERFGIPGKRCVSAAS
jgi:hypothetical protein